MRTPRAGYVEHGHVQGVRLLSFGRVELSLHVEVCAVDVAVDEQGQVDGVHIPLPVALVDLDEVKVSILRILHKKHIAA